MTNMMWLLIIIGITVFVSAGIIVYLAVAGGNDVHCSKCGSQMYYIGNDETYNNYKGLPRNLMHHYYKCPKCKTVIRM